MAEYNLPGVSSVEFSFVDPIFLFTQHCNELHKCGLTLQWDPVKLLHPLTGERLYGAGIQCGRLLHAATENLPSNGKAALLNISWDAGNTGYAGRSASPICLQVMNVNASSPKAVGLLGYVPRIQYNTDTKGASEARRHVLQECVAHILDSIESKARYGFRYVIGV